MRHKYQGFMHSEVKAKHTFEGFEKANKVQF